MARAEPALPDQSDGEGFSAFAAAQGAHALPELLEAAAAYMADVEGRDQFSRPMLMHKLREVEAEGFSREEGLRSFGQLLRSGKLQKLKGGRFTVTDSTEYRPAARNAAPLIRPGGRRAGNSLLHSRRAAPMFALSARTMGVDRLEDAGSDGGRFPPAPPSNPCSQGFEGVIQDRRTVGAGSLSR